VAITRTRVATVTAAVGFVAVALFFAACGGASGPGVASVGSSTTTTSLGAATPTTNSATYYVDAVKYSQCMRTHGVPSFPDPDGQGVIVLEEQTHEALESPQGASANKACEHLLPNGGQPTAAQTQAELAEGVKYAQCMRTHGLPTFPDPTIRHGRMFLTPGSIPPSVFNRSPANRACQSLLPQGIPGSVAGP
jgi:hypothetical protein